MSVIYQVWWGRRSLAETFWLWGILVGGLIDCTYGLAWGATLKVFTCDVSGSWSFAYLYLFVALSVATGAWLAVGVARSRTRIVAPWSFVVKAIAVIATVAVPSTAVLIPTLMWSAICR